MRTFTLPMDTRGRVTLPPELRRHLGLPNGGKVEWFIDEHGEVAMRSASQLTTTDREGDVPELPGREQEK
jgi:bifunctional DNA-binding transcriptional regulator/antitoxin component of YhaV-PrlF toxin-antitoxin module